MSVDVGWLRSQFPEIQSLNSLSKGGQKSVLSGNHKTEGDVVLKIYHINTDADRVIREIEAVKSIASSRVPKIYEVGTKASPIGQFIWLREEYVSGSTLKEVLQKKGSLEIKDTLRIGLHLLEALHSAEQQSIVHRDVKPDNTIIDADGNTWLIDFGLARHLNLESLTATSDYFGAFTPGYAPPEQFRNQKKDIDSRADLFALGVTLYECIEGRNPFQDQARDWNEVIRRVENISLPALPKEKVGDSGFSDLVQSMTRKWPDHRLRTVGEALVWIQEIIDEEEI